MVNLVYNGGYTDMIVAIWLGIGLVLNVLAMIEPSFDPRSGNPSRWLAHEWGSK